MKWRVLTRSALFLFKIENFSDNGEESFNIQSPDYVCESLGGIKWNMSLELTSDECISCNLFRCKDNSFPEGLYIDYSLQLMNGNDEIVASFSENCKSFSTCCSIFCENLVKIDDIYADIRNWKHDTLTVQCIMNLATETKIPSSYIAKTDFITEQDHLNWKREYNEIELMDGKTREFHLDKILSTFKLDTSIEHDNIVVQEIIYICLIDDKSGNRTCLLNCKVSALGDDGTRQQLFKGQKLFKYNGSTWKFYFQHRLTFSNKRKLKLIYDFSASSKTKLPSTPIYDSSLPANFTSVLQDDLRELYLSKKHTDVTLKAGNQDLLVHKSILVARSPVFSTMFDQNMLENQSGVVDIPDVEVETLNSFLEFIYTGTICNLNYDNAVNLLVIAEKYQVHSLIEECVSYLSTVLSDKNACELMCVADMVNHERFKTATMKYIAGHTQDILSSAEWSKWTINNLRLTSEILTYIASHCQIKFG